jgi:GNAT superfamily N-acetyltransferase
LVEIITYDSRYYQALVSMCLDFKQQTQAVSDVFDALQGNADELSEAIEAYIKLQIDNPTVTVLLALEAGMPVGFVIGQPSEYFPFCKIERIGHIKELFVSRLFRGKGMGKQLLNALEQVFYRQGITNYKIETVVYYPQNKGFYESMGYQVFLLDMRKSA